jgi:hypothetical protein
VLESVVGSVIESEDQRVLESLVITVFESVVISVIESVVESVGIVDAILSMVAVVTLGGSFKVKNT